MPVMIITHKFCKPRQEEKNPVTQVITTHIYNITNDICVCAYRVQCILTPIQNNATAAHII